MVLRGMAKKRGMLVNEYGIYQVDANGKSGKRLGGEFEKDLYRILGVPYHPPELRGSELYTTVPKLIQRPVGDGHCHTYWSQDADQDWTIAKLATHAKSMGHQFVCVTDHSYSPAFTKNGKLEPAYVDKYVKECRRAEKVAGIRVLAGIECDILPDGTLQWPESELRKLDYVVAAIHRQHSVDVTSRYVSAMNTGLVDVIAHPQNRLLGQRPASEVDWDLICTTAAEKGVALEINGGFDRLDLSAEIAAKAAKAGVKLSLASDCHSRAGCDCINYAVMIARRAGLEQAHIYVPG